MIILYCDDVELKHLFDKYDDTLYLTGYPMRFTARGPIVTDW